MIDIVIVLKLRDNKIADRPMLVLLQNKDKSYRLDKMSQMAFPAEYNNVDFKLYHTEDISIENRKLLIMLYGIGPSGNLYSAFKYFGNELVLTYIETYNMGAGSHQKLDYDLETSKIVQEIINTTEDDMPSELKTFHLKEKKYLFENASPNEIISGVYQLFDN